MKILATAKQTGSAAALVSPIKELLARGHEVTIYATGSEQEAKGFRDLPYTKFTAEAGEDYSVLLRNQDALLVGLSGAKTPDGHFIRAGNSAHVPTIAVNDQNLNYLARFEDVEGLPKILALMDETCLEGIRKELAEHPELCEEALKRARITGWSAFDDFAKVREEYRPEQRVALLKQLELDPEKPIHTYFSMNIHPDTKYLESYVKDNPGRRGERQEMFDYELKVTERVFEASSDLGAKLLVKPHPGEEFTQNFTEELCKKHDFAYLPAKACNTRDLMLAAYSILAGRSTCLTEGCLLDRNTGAILPEITDVSAYPSVLTKAIPATSAWGHELTSVVAMVMSQDSLMSNYLARRRKLFSVDGQAGKRVADVVEEIGR